jgi:cation diffusion facilitator CzcD-associated flavoprotein CzcO
MSVDIDAKPVEVAAAATDATMPLDAEAIVVGTGFAGLGMAIALKRAGMDSFLVLERSDDIGGTWRDNRYPGCACDIPSILYSFSFEHNKEWTRVYSPQDEIWDYLRRCADRFGIRPHIRFGTAMIDAAYDEATATWRVRTSDGRTLVSRVLIGGFGPLNKPNIPNLPGLERFAGPAFHSSAWDHSVDLTGKNVAVIGTGASAIQFVPQIVPAAGRVYVFQRTAPWIIKKPDGPLGALHRRLRRIAPFAWLERTLVYWLQESLAYGFTINPRALQTLEARALRYLEREIADPELRRKLTPSFRLGCKRILFSYDYLPALRQPNVEVVTSGIREVREHAIVDDDGVERRVDAIVFGTGFRATEGVAPMTIYGLGGVELNDAWRDGMEAYLGTSVAGFPNYFSIVGPNTGLGHNSIVLMIEAQVRYIMSALRLMKRRKLRALDVRRDVQTEFNSRLQEKLKGTVWATGCRSWYLDRNGKNTTLWPGFTYDFLLKTRRIDPRCYELRT